MLAAPSAGQDHAKRKTRILAVLLLVGFYVSFITYIATTAIDTTVLSPDYYNSALDDNRVYDRFYNEVLADPQFSSLTQDLLGGTDSGDERAIAVSLLRLVLPPDTLKTVTEQTITAIIAYLNGDTKRIDTRVDLDSIMGNLNKMVGQQAANLLASAKDEHQDSIDAFDTVLQQFVTDLQSGAIPNAIPSVDASSDTTNLVLNLLFGRQGLIPDPATRSQVEAALQAGDSRGALIVAAGGIQAGLASGSVNRLEGRLENGRYLDPLTAISRIAGQPEGSILHRFNAVRSEVEAFPSHLRYVALVVMVFCMAYMSHLAPSGRHQRLRAVGLMMLIACVLALITVAIAARVIEGQLENALSAGALSQAPPSVSKLVRDVESSLSGELNRSLLQPVILVLLVAIVTVTASLMPAGFVRRLRAAVRVLFTTRPGQVGLVGLLAGVVALGAGLWLMSRQTGPRMCNGHVELCKRPLNQVVFAATHNSMSAAADGWLFPDQEYGISDQLNAGIRGLLIDTHYWDKQTDFQDATGTTLPGGLSTSLSSLLSSLGTPRDGPLLCHTFCVLGSQPLADGLGDIRHFMDQNRNEVIVILVEDYITSADTQKAFQQSGLLRYVYTHPQGANWPTLGKMIRSNKRLVVFAENGKPPPPWYQNAFVSSMQDTNYRIETADGFDCTLNRGKDTAGILLLNHWIDKLSPDRADAATVNTQDSILKQADLCQTQRNRKPNLIAVDFYSIGEVLQAVDKLNGVKEP